MSARPHRKFGSSRRDVSRAPTQEHATSRSPSLGYEPPEEAGFIHCLAHGYPTPLARWHFHDEYELHIITATSGKAFVGDWIGPFQPGQVVLCGPRLPHNWVSLDAPESGVPERDLVLQFPHDPMARAIADIPELREVVPMLGRAPHGIEFYGVFDSVRAAWGRIRHSRGLERFAHFCALMGVLSRCREYRLLSSVQLQSSDQGTARNQMHDVVDRISSAQRNPPPAHVLATELGMSESAFSRHFRRETGNTYTDFVNQVRIHRACQLLMETDLLVARICFDVGFNNVANFNRRFQDIKGMTPTAFRRQSTARFGPNAQPRLEHELPEGFAPGGFAFPGHRGLAR